MKRVKPLPKPVPIYETSWSQYPDRLRVSMEDGTVVDYQVIIKQPQPVLKDLLDQLDHTVFGYGGQKYKQKGIGKRDGRSGTDANT